MGHLRFAQASASRLAVGGILLGACSSPDSSARVRATPDSSATAVADAMIDAPPGSPDTGPHFEISEGGDAPLEDRFFPGQDGSCAAVAAKAELIERPADIIWAIDNSGSMSDEVAAVRRNMNAFGTRLETSGVDAHVVLVTSGSLGYNGICIDAPFGSGRCPDDSLAPRYLHVDQDVQSWDSLKQLIATFSKWYGALRPASVKAFVVVTDDESGEMTAAAFVQQIQDLWPKYPHAFDGWSLSGAYCQAGALCANCAAAGTVYEQLRSLTGGIFADLCQVDVIAAPLPDAGISDGAIDAGAIVDAGPRGSDWGAVFSRLADEVSTQTKITCDWSIPSSNQGTVDPRKVNVQFTPGAGGPLKIGKVPVGSDCASGGWIYDDEQSPRRVRLCPSTCATVQADAAATIELLFGCATVEGGGIIPR